MPRRIGRPHADKPPSRPSTLVISAKKTWPLWASIGLRSKDGACPTNRASTASTIRLIVEAMREKLRQNRQVRQTLLATGDLILKPDHHQSADDPDEWRYFELWMQFRSQLQTGKFR